MKCLNSKQYLRQAYKLHELINDKKERLAYLQEMQGSIGAIDYAKDRVQISPSNDASFTGQVSTKLMLEVELEEDIRRFEELYVEISHAIDDVEDPNCRLVLSKRYLLMKTWEQIADDIGYSLTQVHRIHKTALENFIVPKS